MENQSMKIAKEILNQLGGGRFIAMTGAKHLGADTNGLVFQFMANTSGFNRCRITLNAMDTYDVQFFKIRKYTVVNGKEYSGVYCDQLQSIFTSFTGLHTRLF